MKPPPRWDPPPADPPPADPPPPDPRWILHPALIAAAFVLEVALANKIEPAGFGRSLVLGVVAAMALTLICWAATRDRWLGGMVATALVIASISLLPIYFAWEALRATVGPDVTLVAFAFVVAALLALPAIQVIRVRRGHRLIRRPATSALNRLAGVLVIVVVLFEAGLDLPGAAANAFRSAEPVTVAPTLSRARRTATSSRAAFARYWS